MTATRGVRRVLAVLVAVLVLAPLAPGTARAADAVRVPASSLSLSARGASFIATFEGFRARPYDDPGGHCTIGFGHLIHLGGCTAADRDRWGAISRSRGLALLHDDADGFVAGLRSRLGRVRLSQAQFDALVSFTYNIGLGGFDSSSVKKDLLAVPPRYGRVPGHLKLWVYSSGQFLCGLYRRRVDEGQLFSSGSYRIDSPPCPSPAAAGPADALATVAPGSTGS